LCGVSWRASSFGDAFFIDGSGNAQAAEVVQRLYGMKTVEECVSICENALSTERDNAQKAKAVRRLFGMQAIERRALRFGNALLTEWGNTQKAEAARRLYGMKTAVYVSGGLKDL
jgi:hypothetical protein